MKDRRAFSDDVGKVIQNSLREARRLRHNQIEVEHLLLGIIAEPDCEAAELLQRFGCDFSELRKTVENTFRLSERVAPETGHMPLTKEAESVLRNTYEEADETGGEKIGTEHILLSLLHDHAKAVARVMEQACGITYEQVRAEL